ncbi:hypothetical protein FE257_005414 [Aspergillus nanangensis]|uniref:Uncharacterized protein n=1 Tax=Aspergillus nanangensis TaxID=2582783 RepID=A0AAD4CR21_ASPNN|nr:hypothetical protein FE257_005414 [Aspergillus nanangensis]
MREGLDLPEFGHLPFDEFVIKNWDPASLLSQTEQKRLLVKKWIALGKYGRNTYALATFEEPMPENIPPTIPQNLLSEDDRAIASMLTSTLWIRTWFGSTTPDTDPTSEQTQEADTAYSRLRKAVLQQGHENYHVPCISPEFVFEDRRELSPETHEGRSPDITRGVATGRPASVPGYLVAAMMHCPELFWGVSEDEWRRFNAEEQQAEELEESDRSQAALVLVADRKACEEGWVLGLAVNHRGQILPFRVRERAKAAAQLAFDWQEGQPLAEIANDEAEDIEYYLGQRGDGWD